MPTPVLAEWMRRVPQARYTNLYGPTETTIASSYYDVPAVPADETESLPIGLACPGEKLVVLDDERRPLPPGEIGQIFIGGVALSPGYWRDEAKTEAAFVSVPTARAVYRPATSAGSTRGACSATSAGSTRRSSTAVTGSSSARSRRRSTRSAS